jgi:DNA-binding CsgD family transcriptional regulator
LQAARDIVQIGIAVCELTGRMRVDECTLALYEPTGRPSLTVDNTALPDQERLHYVASGWQDDECLRELREHHAPVAGRACLLLPILAPGYVLGSIRCSSNRLDDHVRRDLTTLASYVSVRAAELGITTRRDPQIAALTQRQLDVAHLVNHTNAEIGELGLSENTVKKHLKDIFATLGATNRTECANRMRHDAPRNRAPIGVTRIGDVAITRANLAVGE